VSGRRVPPLTCILSFVRLLHIRQPDNTMASTRYFVAAQRFSIYFVYQSNSPNE
jgi:hypothetical protein